MADRRNPFTRPLGCVLFLALALAGANALAAQKTATWTGGGDGSSYGDPLNWDINEVPVNNVTDTYVVAIPASKSVAFNLPDPGVGTNQVDRLSLAAGSTLTINPARSLSVLDAANVGGTVSTTSGTFNAPSAASSFTGNAAKISVNGTGSVTLGAATYDSRGIQNGLILSADGSGASVSLAQLQTLTDSSNFTFAQTRTIQAINNGVLDLSGVTSVLGGTGDDVTRFLESSGGTISLGSLTTVENNVLFESYRSSFSLPALRTAANMTFSLNPGYTLNLVALEEQTGGTYALAAGDTVNLDALTRLENARVTINDAASVLSAPVLGDIDNTFFNLKGGAQLALSVPNYVGTGFASGTFFSADGTGTLLDLSAMRSINSSADFTFAQTRTIAAVNNGVVDLSALETLSGPGGDDVLEVKTTGGGVVPLDSLTTATGRVRFTTDANLTVPVLSNAGSLFFSMQPGSTLNLPELVSQTGGTYDPPAGADFHLPKLTSAPGTTILISDSAAVFDAPLLANIDNGFVNLSGGAPLGLRNVTNYVGTGFASGTFFSAAGSGTVLDLSGLKSIDSAVNHTFAQTRTISASEGGSIYLCGLTALKGGTGDDKLRVAVGSSGLIDLSSLQSVSVGNVVFDVDAEGTLLLGDFTVTGNSTFNVNDVTSVVDVAGSLLLDTGSTFSVATGGGLSVGGNFSFATQSETAFTASSGILSLDGAGTFGAPQFLEVGGLDAGLGDPGNNGNFGIGQLAVGTDLAPTVVSLLDVIDNGNRASPEALYLFGLGGPDGLLLRGGSTLVIWNIPVYAWVNGQWMYLNDLFTGSITKVDFAAITNNPGDSGYVAIPEPAALTLLAAGGLVLVRRARRTTRR